MDPPGEQSASRASHHVSVVPTENVFAGAIVPASVDVVSVPAIQSRGAQHMDQPSTLVPLNCEASDHACSFYGARGCAEDPWSACHHGMHEHVAVLVGFLARLLGRMLKRRDMTDEIDFILADGTGAIQDTYGVVTNYNAITNHFLQCVYVHLDLKKRYKDRQSDIRRMELSVAAHEQSSPVSDRGNRLFDDVLRVFYHPGILQLENGASFTLIQSQTGADAEQLRCVIGAHVAMGNLFTTIDDDHYKCSFNG
ncbi:hypothetical protein VPH35_108227 [Triticum aestivum]